MIDLVFSVDVLGLLHDAAHLYTTRMEHSPTSATGTGWERTPWHAMQRAAWAALRKRDQESPVTSLLGWRGANDDTEH
jgi:hypothetical protein